MCTFLAFRETSPQMVLNLLKAKENVNVPLDCPAAKKPQQIVAAQPKHSNKPKVRAQSKSCLFPKLKTKLELQTHT